MIICLQDLLIWKLFGDLIFGGWVVTQEGLLADCTQIICLESSSPL